MKQIFEAIHVQTGEGGVPSRVFWRGGMYEVQAVEESWRYAGKWWDGQGCRRAYYKLTVRQVGRRVGALSLETYKQGSQWMLSRILD